MVDTLYSCSEETPLNSNVAILIGISESAVVRDSMEGKSDCSRQTAEVHSCVPKIVVMESVSGECGGSFSAGDSLNAKDARSSTKNKRRGKKGRRNKDQDARACVLAAAEGQRGELARCESGAVSSEPKLLESGWTDFGLATAIPALEKHTAMERADISPSYTSDEWEEARGDRALSDTDDDDHTDSSDDDDPKSQVDRLIERGTLMYMEGETSALSSEDESDDSDDYDSESDITDVSPLMSATASPLGLSPVLPRRTIPTSPLALHDNRELSFAYDPSESPFVWDPPSPESHHSDSQLETGNDNHHLNNNNSTNMDLLLQAVIELENKNTASKYNLNHHPPRKTSALPTHSSDPVFIHPIRDNPHHHHLRKNLHRRKNMSFSNEEVRKIDQENKILLKKIMAAHTRPKPAVGADHPLAPTRSYQRPSHATVNRRKGEERIRRDNLLLFKKIQDVKPSEEVVDSRLPSLGGLEPLLANTSLRSPTSSCGAFMRSMTQPALVAAPPPRKETAL